MLVVHCHASAAPPPGDMETDPFILQRNQTTLGHLHPTITPPNTHRPVVPLATTPPNSRPGMPLPATTPQTSQNAAVVLGVWGGLGLSRSIAARFGLRCRWPGCGHRD